MEALIGFAVGYLVGTRDGREGLERVIDAWQSISRSEEFRSLLATGLSIGSGLLSRGLGQAAGGRLGEAVVGVLLDRARAALGGQPQLRAVS
jgi:hypothetical protein